MKLTIATFNVENLLSTLPVANEDGSPRWDGPLRYLKRDRLSNPEALLEALTLVEEHDKRRIGALVIAALDADVIALQEVESEPVLRQFRNEYLDPITDGEYRFLKLMEGNDGRGIDVAFLSRIPLESVKNHVELRYEEVEGAWTETLARTLDRYKNETRDAPRQRYPRPDDFIFRRGVLQADVEVGDRVVTLFAAHLKSMGTPLQPSFTTARSYTAPLRRAEALGLRHIVRERFGRSLGEAAYAICGDLNDMAWENGHAGPRDALSIAPLLDPSFAVNVIEDLPPEERWTTWYDETGSFSQLDYVLISPALRAANPTTRPHVERRGLGWRVPWRAGSGRAEGPRWVTGKLNAREALAFSLDGLERFPRVGFDRPAASDHAGLAVTLTIPRA